MFNIFNAYSVELYIGEQRSGKTLTMTADTYENLKEKGFPDVSIFSNYNLNPKYFGKVNKVSRKDLHLFYKNEIEFSNSIFLIDEFQTWLDSRDHQDKGNKAITYFLGQMGKRGNILRGTTHDMMQIDIRGRLYATLRNYCVTGLVEYDGRGQGTWKQLLNNYRVLSEDEQNRHYIKVDSYVKKLINKKYQLPEFKYIKLEPRLVKAKDYYDFYDTMELIKRD